jgi:hypothetical protein
MGSDTSKPSIPPTRQLSNPDPHQNTPFNPQSLTPSLSNKPEDFKAHLYRLLTRPSINPTSPYPHFQPRNIRIQPNTEVANTFYFFGLPVELRRKIYSHLLVSSDRILITDTGPCIATSCQNRMHIDALLACKQMYSEAIIVLYGENMFDFESVCIRSMRSGRGFVAKIGAHNASMIRIVVAEHCAAAEEFSEINFIIRRPQRLEVAYLHTFFAAFSIRVENLRVLAISFAPYGYWDIYTFPILFQMAERLDEGLSYESRGERRLEWLKARNSQLVDLVGQVCKREGRREEGGKLGWLEHVGFEEGVSGRKGIGFQWETPWRNREWVVWKGERYEREL